VIIPTNATLYLWHQQTKCFPSSGPQTTRSKVADGSVDDSMALHIHHNLNINSRKIPSKIWMLLTVNTIFDLHYYFFLQFRARLTWDMATYAAGRSFSRFLFFLSIKKANEKQLHSKTCTWIEAESSLFTVERRTKYLKIFIQLVLKEWKR
jgi:hypothetical protein